MKKQFMLLFLIIALAGTVFAQSDIQMFGFFQSSLTKLDGNYSVISTVPKAIYGTDKLLLQGKTEKYNSSSLSQLNLFFRKELNNNITAWVNFEVLGNFNSSKNWGSYSIEEAWVNYQSSDAFNIKVGLLIPRFAYLNEIKNRMPLLPYITRPLVYEASNQSIEASNYIPEKAFIQASGYIPLGDITLDYSAFIGSSESSYILAESKGTTTDTTNFKLFGGRVGIKSSTFHLGVSTTFDKNNLQKEFKEDVNRTRIAFDLGYSTSGLFFEGEYILVKLNPKNTTKDLDKLFYYGTLGYNITDDLFAYGSYSYIDDQNNNTLASGMKGVIFGAGYKVTDSFIIKGGYSTYFADSSFPLVLNQNLPAANTNVKIDYKLFQLAVSVLF